MAAPQPKPAVYAIKETPDGYAIQNNGVPVKTPAGETLVVPTAALAAALVEELQAQPGGPLMQLAATAVDIVAKKRSKTLDEILAFANTEHLCHRAENSSALALEQEEVWQPLLDWCAEEFDAPLQSAPGVMVIGQSPDSIKAIRRAIEKYDDFRLAGIIEAARKTGSLVLGLALAEKHITPEQAFHAAELDTTHQMKKWGEDPATIARHSSIKRDLENCRCWFAALRPSP